MPRELPHNRHPAQTVGVSGVGGFQWATNPSDPAPETAPADGAGLLPDALGGRQGFPPWRASHSPSMADRGAAVNGNRAAKRRFGEGGVSHKETIASGSKRAQ